MEQNYLLDDLQPEPVYASTGKRFLNFVVDVLGFYAILFAIMIPMIIFNPASFQPDANGNDPFDGIFWNIAGIVLFFLYYFLFEYATGGRTLGKLITGTKAVNTDGSRIDLGTSLKRNAIRLVPFEVFSYFGSPCNPWHDSWTDTMVMDIKKSRQNQF